MRLPALLAAAAAAALIAGCGSSDQTATTSDDSAAVAASTPAATRAAVAESAPPPAATPAPDSSRNVAPPAPKMYATQPFEQLGVAACDQLASDVKHCLDTQPESFDRAAQRKAFERAVRGWQNQIEQGVDQATMAQTCTDFRDRIRDQLAKLGCVAI